MPRPSLLPLLLGLIALKGEPALAGTAAPAAAGSDWSGFYIGGHFGYGSGSTGPATNPFSGEAGFLNSSPTGFVGGYQLGYNWQVTNRFVFGLEADVSFPSPRDSLDTRIVSFHTGYNYIATIRPRIGYQVGSFLPYITGGFAWGSSRVDLYDPTGAVVTNQSEMHTGWTVGAGLELPIAGNWTGKFEYDYVDLGTQTYNVAQYGLSPALNVESKTHLFKAGLNYRLNPPKSVSDSDPANEGWSIHGQTTFLPQGYGPFRSPYSGSNSLPSSGMIRETWTATAFIGRKLWEGGEVYFNPELAQGFGLAHTLGVAGFTNGEAQKAGAEYPRVRAQRYFLRQTWGLGGEQETVEDGANQIAGKRDVDRITLTVGRFSVGDFFDNNTYAHDPRADFMNWSIWASAAYDFPADLPGFTRGGVLELNRKDWAIRAGLFQVPNAPGGDALEFTNGAGGIVEFEQRYAIQGQPGKFRVGLFSNRGRMANFRESVAIASATGTDVNDVAAGLRSIRTKNGFYANAEQAVSKDLGVFGRVSWADGNNEALSFTDIDRSAAAGISLKGTQWQRPNDTFGFAGALNGLSGAHQDFFAAGGTGILVGDGRLPNYSPERILETYYSIALRGPMTLTLDYQFVANPAYNADRGPVSVVAARFHAEF